MNNYIVWNEHVLLLYTVKSTYCIVNPLNSNVDVHVRGKDVMAWALPSVSVTINWLLLDDGWLVGGFMWIANGYC